MVKTKDIKDINAEREALHVTAAKASTLAEHIAVIKSVGHLETAETKATQRNALDNARIRGAAMFGAYKAIKATQNVETKSAQDTTFAAIRDALGMGNKATATTAATWTEWNGIKAYSTAEQAWNIHQWCATDSVITEAHAAFVAEHPAEAKEWLGVNAASVIGLATFARGVQKPDAETKVSMMPTSGSRAEQRKLLVARSVERAETKTKASADKAIKTETETKDKRDAVISRVEYPSATTRFVDSVHNLSTLTVSGWTKTQRAALVDALVLIAEWERVADDVETDTVAQVVSIVETPAPPAPASDADLFAEFQAFKAFKATQTA